MLYPLKHKEVQSPGGGRDWLAFPQPSLIASSSLTGEGPCGPLPHLCWTADQLGLAAAFVQTTQPRESTGATVLSHPGGVSHNRPPPCSLAPTVFPPRPGVPDLTCPVVPVHSTVAYSPSACPFHQAHHGLLVTLTTAHPRGLTDYQGLECAGSSANGAGSKGAQ